MNMLALTIILPLIGFVLLAFSRGRWSENLSATIGVGSVGLAALVTAFVGMDFFANGKQAFSQPLWTWMSVGNFNIGFNPVLDGLSLTMLSVVTGVGFLIHMFASGTCVGKRVTPASSLIPTCLSPAWLFWCCPITCC